MKPRHLAALAAASVFALSACSGADDPAPPVEETDASASAFAAVSDDRLDNAAATPGEWLSYGFDREETRHSPLTGITTGNVADLGVAWTYDLATSRGVESTPIVVDGTMYVTSAWSIVYALDAKTGEELWVYDPDVDRAVGVNACCDVVNRGVAVYEGKLYLGVIDGRVEALDAKTGEVIWSKVTVDQSKPYTITGAPRVVDGKVLIGNGGAELGVRGYLNALDADTGELIWRFYTVRAPTSSRMAPHLTAPSSKSEMSPGATPAPGKPMVGAAQSGTRSSMTRSMTVSSLASAMARHGTSVCATRPGSTICSCRPSSRWTPIAANISGTSRPRRATIGIIPRRRR